MNCNTKYWFPRPGSYSNYQMCGLRQSLCFPFCDRDAEESTYKLGCEPGMVVPTCNPRTAEAREGDQEVSGRPELQAKFQACLGCTCKTLSKQKTRNSTAPANDKYGPRSGMFQFLLSCCNKCHDQKHPRAGKIYWLILPNKNPSLRSQGRNSRQEPEAWTTEEGCPLARWPQLSSCSSMSQEPLPRS